MGMGFWVKVRSLLKHIFRAVTCLGEGAKISCFISSYNITNTVDPFMSYRVIKALDLFATKTDSLKLEIGISQAFKPKKKEKIMLELWDCCSLLFAFVTTALPFKV
jgi:hypothetical protein